MLYCCSNNASFFLTRLSKAKAEWLADVVAMTVDSAPSHASDQTGRPSAISASPTACPLRGCGCAGTKNDRLSDAVILSTGAPVPAQSERRLF